LPAPQPPSTNSLPASLGTIGIVSVPVTQSFVFSNEKTFFGGAAQGLKEWSETASYVDSHSRSYSPYAGVALLLMLPVAPIVGGVNAWSEGLSSSHKREIEKVFRELLPPGEAQSKLRKDIVGLAHDYSARDLLDVAVDAESNPTFSRSDASVQNVDTVLEVSLLPAAIISSDQDDPALQVTFSARARLLRASDRNVLWKYDTTASSGEVIQINLSQLTSTPGEQLKPQIDAAIESLAHDIVVRIFGETSQEIDEAAVAPQLSPDQQNLRQ